MYSAPQSSSSWQQDEETVDDGSYAAEGKSSNAAGVVAFVLSLLLLINWVPVIGYGIAWITALIFSIVGIFRRPRGLAITGLIICIMILVGYSLLDDVVAHILKDAVRSMIF